MKRFLTLTFLVVALASSAFADHLYLATNGGAGDNFGFVGRMNGHRLVLSGGTTASFFSSDGYTPGSPFGGESALFLYSTIVWVDGVPTEFFFPPGTLFMTPFTLPTDGRSFRVPVQISFSANGINFDTGQTIGVGGGANGHISFDFSNGLYYASDFAQAPEPGTWTLVGTGLIAFSAFLRNRFTTQPRPH